jgi:hypothetical protein
LVMLAGTVAAGAAVLKTNMLDMLRIVAGFVSLS